VDLVEVGWGDVYCIGLALDRDRWRALTTAEVKETLFYALHSLISLNGVLLNFQSTGTTLPFTLLVSWSCHYTFKNRN
jgi:hypothetical protein